jgi:hypothetical protein
MAQTQSVTQLGATTLRSGPECVKLAGAGDGDQIAAAGWAAPREGEQRLA